jgi:hypothetical protein
MWWLRTVDTIAGNARLPHPMRSFDRNHGSLGKTRRTPFRRCRIRAGPTPIADSEL